jgi:OOP family OmpA-OmpF porin
MRLKFATIVSLTFILAAGLCIVVAGFAVTAVERGSEIAVRRTLDETRHEWAEVTADGLAVILEGTAPDEAARFTALSSVGGVVDAARIIDRIRITPSDAIAAPRFSAEILRNSSGISIIGLIPDGTDRADITSRLRSHVGAAKVTDLLETADYPVPDLWLDAMSFGVNALEHLPRAKISIAAGQVSITAMAQSAEDKAELETKLQRAAPPGLRLALMISAPRPVITPFTLRFSIEDGTASFDACSAESSGSRASILAAARAAGLNGKADCTVGMGVPSPNWARAAGLGIASVAELGSGSITMANADMTLAAAPGTNQAKFDRIAGELKSALPDVFALHTVLPPAEDASGASAVPEFTATLSPEGQVQLRGRLGGGDQRSITEAYAKARFGSGMVYVATREVQDLPQDWPLRVLAGLDALSRLERGILTVTPDLVQLRGMSHQEDTRADVARILAGKLGEEDRFTLAITYEAPPEPENKVKPPELCEAELATAQAGAKIAFEPGSATIAGGSGETMDRIAGILGECGELRLEIQGHTDSQGREEMNQNLSQARAQSVLNELRARRVLTSTYAAKGYGESRPIADNSTEEGREANRRIEFRLLRPEPDPQEGSEAETDPDAPAAEAPAEQDTPPEEETEGQ